MEVAIVAGVGAGLGASLARALVWGGFLELDPKTIRESFEVGVMGAVYLCQAVVPEMLALGHGSIHRRAYGATRPCRLRPLAIAKSSLRMLA